MKRFIIITIMLILLASLTIAADYNIEIKPITETIEQEGTAEFLAIFESNVTRILTIDIYTPEVEWNVPAQTIKAYPEKDTSTKITIKPTKYVGPGNYGVKINFKEGEEITEKVLYVNVKPPGKAVSSYLPSVTMETAKAVMECNREVLTALNNILEGGSGIAPAG